MTLRQLLFRFICHPHAGLWSIWISSAYPILISFCLFPKLGASLFPVRWECRCNTIIVSCTLIQDAVRGFGSFRRSPSCDTFSATSGEGFCQYQLCFFSLKSVPCGPNPACSDGVLTKWCRMVPLIGVFGNEFCRWEVYAASVRHESKNVLQSYATFWVGCIEVCTPGPYWSGWISLSRPYDSLSYTLRGKDAFHGYQKTGHPLGRG